MNKFSVKIAYKIISQLMRGSQIKKTHANNIMLLNFKFTVVSIKSLPISLSQVAIILTRPTVPLQNDGQEYICNNWTKMLMENYFYNLINTQ